MNKWVKAQEWEKDWHLTQQFNSYNEETKPKHQVSTACVWRDIIK